MVVVSQHVQNIETLTENQGSELKENYLRTEGQEEPKHKRGKQSKKGRTPKWTCDSHMNDEVARV